MERCEKIVLEAEKGITFNVSKRTSGELIIRALNSTTANACSPNISTANEYSANYANPPIPKGYKHICGEWNNGFVIERCSDGSQFVWIPVGSLEPNGTIDGKNFSEKFGRRIYCKYDRFENELEYIDDEVANELWKYNEPLNGTLLQQCGSVEKYGGFYISRYNISQGSRSVKGAIPSVCIDFYLAWTWAREFELERSGAVQSHLPFGAEYDSVLEWLIKTKAKTLAEITKDSTKWGHSYSPDRIVETGSREEWCANNIYDLAGNVMEWTQEQCGRTARVIRGGNYIMAYPPATRHSNPPSWKSSKLGFRVALWIE